MTNKKTAEKKLDKKLSVYINTENFNKITGYCETKNISKSKLINTLINKFFEGDKND